MACDVHDRFAAHQESALLPVLRMCPSNGGKYLPRLARLTSQDIREHNGGCLLYTSRCV